MFMFDVQVMSALQSAINSILIRILIEEFPMKRHKELFENHLPWGCWTWCWRRCWGRGCWRGWWQQQVDCEPCRLTLDIDRLLTWLSWNPTTSSPHFSLTRTFSLFFFFIRWWIFIICYSYWRSYLCGHGHPNFKYFRTLETSRV